MINGAQAQQVALPAQSERNLRPEPIAAARDEIMSHEGDSAQSESPFYRKDDELSIQHSQAPSASNFSMRNMDPEDFKKSMLAKKHRNYGNENYKKGKYRDALKNYTDYLSK